MLKPLCLLLQGILICFVVHAQISSVASFTTPDTVCVNAPVNITNTSTGASSYYWNFCVGDISTAPVATDLGTLSGVLSQPVFMDYVYANNNYYGFLINHDPGALIRLDFGNSLLNTPTAVNLGNFGGAIPVNKGPEGIQVVQNEGKWYAIIVGGWPVTGTQPRILKIDFGANILNPSPTVTNWGNIGNMEQPIDLHLFKENNEWYGFTVNAENNTITRFSFTNSFDNTPTAISLGSIGGISYPTGIYTVEDNGSYRVFIVNGGNNTTTSGTFSLTRLDFGSSLLNTPVATNLGNPGNVLQHPRDLTILKSCGHIVGFAVNARPGTNDIVKLDFNNDLSSVPTGVSLGNIGNFDFPHSISKLFRVKDNIYGFITNAHTNKLSRIAFQGCTNASIPSSTAQNPPAVAYNTPGTYNINLTIDDGLPTQSSFCRQVVVVPEPVADFSYLPDPCNPHLITFKNNSTNSSSVSWDFGNGMTAGNDNSPSVSFTSNNTYTVKMTALSAGGCSYTVTKQITVQFSYDDVILTKDTGICGNGNLQLNAVPALTYCWTPATGLSSTTIANPVASITGAIKYFLTTQTTGSNLVVNGDFSQGNTGFTSQYNYATPNVTEGQYYVGTNPQAWNASMSSCKDHTSGNGNMLLINGSPTPDVNVWKQTISVAPNTSYAFSTWIQALWPPNPAQLSFSINGIEIGNPITASLPTCTWSQFYAIWNSGNNSSATIAIVNKNTFVQGNDFALDDISFAPLLVKVDSVTITTGNAIVTTNNDTTICSERSVPLQANGASKYSWSPATGLSNASVSNPVATPAITTQYIVTGTTLAGCTGKDTVNIVVNTKPLILSVHDTLVCPDQPVQLQANPGMASYAWSPAPLVSNPTIADPVALSAQPGTYTVEINDANNCTYKDSVKVHNKSIRFTASPDQHICEGSTVKLNASGGDTYQWTPATALDDAQSDHPVAMPNQDMQYFVHIAEHSCGYDSTIEVNITVHPNPVVSAQKSNDINCTVTTAQLQAQGANTYTWAPATGVDDPAKSNPIASVDTTTLFYVRGANQFGCTDIDSVQVLVTAEGKENFVVPNAFTPNGDNHNDCVGIKRWGHVVIEEFSIYSRWGERVFTTNNPLQCWNGYYKGKLMDNGAYAYVIKAKTFCGHIKRTGIIMLIR